MSEQIFFKQAAAALGVSEAQLTQLIGSRRIFPAGRVSNVPWFTEDELRRFQRRESLSIRLIGGAEYVSATWIAQRMGVSKQTISNRIKAGDIVPDITEGRYYWFALRHAEEIVEPVTA
jgi:predicted DNA-binding protein (UPF0251 family)